MRFHAYFALVVPAVLLSFCLFSLHPAYAALREQGQTLKPDAAWNPHPDDSDILLPMPCGLRLALRSVPIPGGIAHDMRFMMGVRNIEDDRAIYESSVEKHIAASFMIADVPASWRKQVGVSRPEAFSYYFLGKYEVSQLQWDIVTKLVNPDGTFFEGQCPRDVTEADTKPVVNVSWFEVQDFLRRYNAWLIREALSSLPSYAGTNRIGFLRLPTEEEWEFAARGGIKISKEDRDNNDSFLPPDEDFSRYAVFHSEKGRQFTSPLPIGSRLPNPLNLYDTMGNASEMVDGFFHATISDISLNNQQSIRLHGASGGLTSKGGSFRSDEAGILPGFRDEMPLYLKNGEYRTTELGFRLVLAGLTLPSASRLSSMQNITQQSFPAGVGAYTARQEKTKKEDVRGSVDDSKETVITLNQKGDVLDELKRIVNATSSKEVKNNLSQLRQMIAKREEARERQRVSFLEDTVRSALYQAETIRSFAFRYTAVKKILDEEIQNKGANSKNRKEAEEYLDTYYRNLLTAANQYKNHLRKIAGAEQGLIDEILSQLNTEYAGSGSLNRHMQENLKTFNTLLSYARKVGFEKLKSDRICRDIIPKQHLSKMTHFNR